MKKLIVFCALLCSLVSCSVVNDSEPNYRFEILPIESVEIPTEFVLGESYQIKVYYYKPSGCYVFNDFYYVSEFNQRTVAVINSVITDQAMSSRNSISRCQI